MNYTTASSCPPVNSEDGQQLLHEVWMTMKSTDWVEEAEGWGTKWITAISRPWLVTVMLFILFILLIHVIIFRQCFDAVDWVTGKNFCFKHAGTQPTTIPFFLPNRLGEGQGYFGGQIHKFGEDAYLIHMHIAKWLLSITIFRYCTKPHSITPFGFCLGG